MHNDPPDSSSVNQHAPLIVLLFHLFLTRALPFFISTDNCWGCSMTPPPSFPKYWLIYPERKRLSLQQQAHSMLTFSLIFLKQHFTSLIWKHTSRLLLPPDCHANVILLKQLFWKCHTQKSDCGLWKLLTNFHSHHQQLSSELKVSTVNSRMIRSVSLVQENQLVKSWKGCVHTCDFYLRLLLEAVARLQQKVSH